MTFNSYIFVLAFLPIIILIYHTSHICRIEKLPVAILILASIIFYSYKNPSCLIILLFSSLFNYFCYYLLRNKQNESKIPKGILAMGIVVNLALLMYFKYYNFCIDNMNRFLGTDLEIREIILPLGISFITFQQIAFLVDTYRGEIKECNFFGYLLFISYFPHVSSGPIISHKDFFPLLNQISEKIDWDWFASGIYMFVMGLGKKVLIADAFAKAVDWGYSNISQLNSTSALFISLAYSIQIYFDFSGYSDMAIGISRMLKLDLPINFNSPYKAKTILEFWDRWHISLTKFLTKYLYIPLGGSRKGSGRMYVNTMIVFLCSGIWHGASWTFLVWGFLHGCFMVFTKRFKSFFDKIPDVLNQLITLFFVNFTWILFRSGSFNVFHQMMTALFQNSWGSLNENICDFFKPVSADLLFPIDLPIWFWAVAIMTLVAVILLKCKNVQERAALLKYKTVSVVWVILVAIMCICSFSGVSIFVYAGF